MIMTVSAPSLVLTVGLPGSGKSTWTDEQIAKDRTGLVTAVNRDHLRRMLRRPYRTDEDLVTHVQYSAIASALSAGKVVIADDTNLNPSHISALCANLARVIPNLHVTINAQFLYVPLADCIERDAQRPPHEVIGADEITRLWETWHKEWPQLAHAPSPSTYTGLPQLSIARPAIWERAELTRDV